MTAFRMGGAPPGALCPTCSYPHFPFCMRHPPPNASASALPPMPGGSFPPPGLPAARVPGGRPPIHSPQQLPPPHSPLLRPPSALTSYQPSPPLRGQPFPGRGGVAIPDAAAIPNGVPLIGRGSNAFHNQHPGESFQNPIQPHPSHSRLSTPSNHLPPSVEHFPVPVLNSTLSGSPHSGLLANSRPPVTGWPEESDRDNLLVREKGPSMPQWYLDQQRRSGSKGGVAPNGIRSGIGELLRGEEIVPPGPFFGSDIPGSRGVMKHQGRLERDRRDGVFGNEDVVQDVQQRSGYWGFREDMMPSKLLDRDDLNNSNLPGLFFHRLDASGPGNGVLTDSELDRERRMWGIDSARDSSNEKGPFSTQNSGHAWRGSAAPAFVRDATAGGGGGGPKYEMGRRERADEGVWPQHSNLSSSREEELLHEHGLVDDGVRQGPRTSGILPLAEGAGEHWEGHGGRLPGRGHFSIDGPDGPALIGHSAQRRLHKTEGGEHMSGAAMGTGKAAPYHSRQQGRPVNADNLHGAGNLVAPERSPANGERPFFKSSGSGVGRSLTHNGPAADVDTSKYGGQSNHSSNNMPPVQEELDELYYLKHFPQPNDNQSTGGLAISYPSAAVPPLPPPNQAGMREDARPFQEESSRVASQKWANEQRPAGVQNTGHLQQSDRGHHQSALQLAQTPVPFATPIQLQQQSAHLQQPAPLHQRDRSPPQGVQPSHLTPRRTFQKDGQSPGQSYPQHQPSPLHINHQLSDPSKKLPPVQPIHTQQISNGQQAIQPNQPAQMQQQHHQQEQLHHPPHFMQPQVSLPVHQLTQPLPQSQGPLQHQMQQEGQGGQPHPTRFYHNTHGVYQSFSNDEASVNGRIIESGPRSSQASGLPSITHQHPFPSLEAPPLPLNAADAPPPPPPSPPHCQPPSHSPPMAPPPPPPPLPPPLPPSPPPVLPSGLTHASPASMLAPFPGHPHHMEEPSHRLNYTHPTHPLQQSFPGVAQGSGFQSMGPLYMHPSVFGEFRNHGQLFPQQLPQKQEKSKVVDAVSIFRRPGRLTRPDRIVVILRGLPGSGKSYLAKALRDVELMNGGTAPRIHSIDDYFMTEVEKVEGEEGGGPQSGSVRGKKRVIKKVMEYCYEPEMEEVYRGSMLKAFRKTLEEGMFSFIIGHPLVWKASNAVRMQFQGAGPSFSLSYYTNQTMQWTIDPLHGWLHVGLTLIVDDRNVLVADFAQFWAIAKRSGYEVYLLEPPYRDPAGCAARNVHNFKQDQIQEMAKRWEPAPPMYLQLDISSLFRGDDLNAQDITEVEMDTDDMEREGDEHEEEYQPFEHRSSTSELLEENDDKPTTLGDRWEDSDEDAEEAVKPVKRMRFSEAPKNNSDSSGSSSGQGPGNDALSGLMQAYGKREKSVHWADRQDDKDGGTGFSIGSALEKISDLVIGPGPGYNKASNPVQSEDYGLHDENEQLNQSRKFLEQYRAEQDAFKAVFANRRQGGLGLDDEDGA